MRKAGRRSRCLRREKRRYSRSKKVAACRRLKVKKSRRQCIRSLRAAKCSNKKGKRQARCQARLAFRTKIRAARRACRKSHKAGSARALCFRNAKKALKAVNPRKRVNCATKFKGRKLARCLRRQASRRIRLATRHALKAHRRCKRVKNAAQRRRCRRRASAYLARCERTRIRFTREIRRCKSFAALAKFGSRSQCLSRAHLDLRIRIKLIRGDWSCKNAACRRARAFKVIKRICGADKQCDDFCVRRFTQYEEERALQSKHARARSLCRRTSGGAVAVRKCLKQARKVAATENRDFKAKANCLNIDNVSARNVCLKDALKTPSYTISSGKVMARAASGPTAAFPMWAIGVIVGGALVVAAVVVTIVLVARRRRVAAIRGAEGYVPM